MIRGNEKDCICAKIGGRHEKRCDTYRLGQFLIRAEAVKNEMEKNKKMKSIKRHDVAGKHILDACCGSRMFWFDKSHPNALYVDNRVMLPKRMSNGATIQVKPDKIMDFRRLDLPDNSFSIVVFDPPHILKRAGKSSWMKEKYGEIDRHTWRDDLRLGFSELFRVLKPEGALIFKWSEPDIPLKEILALTPVKPLFGHRSGKAQRTHWITFTKTRK